jgi:poly(ADP-ribose) glycohydrolase ARH3
MRLEDRFTGCLLGLALGDAIGAPFEGSPPGKRDLSHLPPVLRYTDDTEMAMGVAESLSEVGGLDEEHLARTFVRNFHAGRGYGPGTVAVLGLIEKGVPWLQANRAVFPQGSFGNGAAMRAAPLGLFFYADPRRLREATYGASSVTHDHPLAKEGALIVTFAVSQIIREKTPGEVLGGLTGLVESEAYQQKLRALRELLEGEEEDVDAVVSRLGHGVEAVQSAPTALYAFLRYGRDYLRTVRFCVSLGGDTDTISAMAGALSGAATGEGGLPGEFLERLEDGDRIRDLALALYYKAAR